MRLTTSLLSLFLSSLVAADVFRGFGQRVLDDDLDVPGDNPLHYCEDPKDDILKIEKVDLDPNPPEAGKSLTIKATGNFTEKVEDGAFVWLTVKLGYVRLIYRKEDLCVQMKNIGKECPLEKGKTTITKDVDLPSRIPPGKFEVKADVYTKDEKLVTCLETAITFS